MRAEERHALIQERNTKIAEAYRALKKDGKRLGEACEIICKQFSMGSPETVRLALIKVRAYKPKKRVTIEQYLNNNK